VFNSILLMALLHAQLDPVHHTEVEAEQNAKRLRGYQQINHDIRQAFRHDAMGKSKRERAIAVVEMTQLYQEIRRDPRLPESKTLEGYKARLWGRLTRVKEEIRKEMARETRRGKRRGDLSGRTGGDKGDVNAPNSQPSGNQVPAFPSHTYPRSGARGGRGVPDWGPGLVELIERTIAPEFWDVNGGPGTIFYYPPLRVLVVRATSEIHHQIGGSLGALRDAGH
jgi:hypothetical protein